MDFLHRLPLLQSSSTYAGGQNSHDIIREVGGACVSGWQCVNVREPIRSLSFVALTHQEDTERQQWWEAGLPAGGEIIRHCSWSLWSPPSLYANIQHLESRKFFMFTSVTKQCDILWIFWNVKWFLVCMNKFALAFLYNVPSDSAGPLWLWGDKIQAEKWEAGQAEKRQRKTQNQKNV